MNTVRFLHDRTNDFYSCYNAEAEYIGQIYQDRGKWVFIDDFIGEADFFDTLEEAKAFVLGLAEAALERIG